MTEGRKLHIRFSDAAETLCGRPVIPMVPIIEPMPVCRRCRALDRKFEARWFLRLLASYVAEKMATMMTWQSAMISDQHRKRPTR